MTDKSLNQLKKERDKLLREVRDAQSKRKLKQSIDLEKKRLQKEIKALKNPGSTAAKKAFLKFTKKSIKSTGNYLAKRARILNENLDEMARREEMARKKVKKNVKKTRKRKKRK